jgi:hypothetical protein
MALKYTLTGKQLRGNVAFAAAITATVQIPTGGFGGTDYQVAITPIAANAAAMPAKFGVANKVAGHFDIVTDAAFTGSFDVLVTG